MKISLILPCYNETLNIQKGVLDKIGNFIKEDKRFVEVIIVDDGSSDDTVEMINKKYIPRFQKFVLVQNSHQGKAYAIISGIKKAKGDFVLFSDIDLATPIEEVEKLIKKGNEGRSIVIGSRSRDRQGAPFLRRLMAVGFIFIRDIFIGLKGLRDTQCGFKLFDRETALLIISRLQIFTGQRVIGGSSVNAGFDIEFLFLASRMGYKIAEVPVIWRHVETKNVNFFKDTIETMKDIFLIKYYDLTGKYRQKN